MGHLQAPLPRLYEVPYAGIKRFAEKNTLFGLDAPPRHPGIEGHLFPVSLSGPSPGGKTVPTRGKEGAGQGYFRPGDAESQRRGRREGRKIILGEGNASCSGVDLPSIGM